MCGSVECENYFLKIGGTEIFLVVVGPIGRNAKHQPVLDNTRTGQRAASTTVRNVLAARLSFSFQ